jgi:hypothetical protein
LDPDPWGPSRRPILGSRHSQDAKAGTGPRHHRWLTVNFNKDYPGGVTIRGVVKMPEKLLVANQDVLDLIVALQTQVADLQARVQALEEA